MRRTVLVLMLVLLLSGVSLAAAQTATPTPTPYGQWCHKWDFTNDDPLDFMTLGQGEYTADGFTTVPSEWGALQVGYEHNLTVFPSQVRIVVEKGPFTSGGVDLHLEGNFFGLILEPTNYYLSAEFESLAIDFSPASASDFNNTFVFYMAASQEMLLTEATVYGFGIPPFDDNCGDPPPLPTVTATHDPNACYLPGEPTPTPPDDDGTYTVNFDNDNPYSFPHPSHVWGSNISASILSTGRSGNGAKDGGVQTIGGTMYRGAIVRVPLDALAGKTITEVSFYLNFDYNILSSSAINADVGFYDEDDNEIAFYHTEPNLSHGAWHQRVFEITDDVSAAAYMEVGIANTSNTPDRLTNPAYHRIDDIVISYEVDEEELLPCTPTPTMTPTHTPTPLTLTPSPSPTVTNTPYPIWTPPTALPTRTPQPTLNPTYLTWSPPVWNTPTPGATVDPSATVGPTSTATFSGPGGGIGGPGGSGGSGGIIPQSDSITGIRQLGESVSGLATNMWHRGRIWVGSMGNAVTRIGTGWANAVPTAPPMMPRCASDPLANELCAIWYILRFTVLAGTLGSLIIPTATIALDLFTLFFFIRLARAIIARLGALFRS